MRFQNLNDLMIRELHDLYSAERQITEALPKMAHAAHSDELKEAFQEHLQVTKRQIERLEEIYKELGLNRSDYRCKGMQGIIEEGEEAAKLDADPAVRDAALISVAQRVEHYEIAAYGAVKTYAKELGHSKIEHLLKKTLDEESDTDKKLTKLATGSIFSKGINKEAITR